MDCLRVKPKSDQQEGPLHKMKMKKMKNLHSFWNYFFLLKKKTTKGAVSG